MSLKQRVHENSEGENCQVSVNQIAHRLSTPSIALLQPPVVAFPCSHLLPPPFRIIVYRYVLEKTQETYPKSSMSVLIPAIVNDF